VTGAERLARMISTGLTVGTELKLMPSWNTHRGQQVPYEGVRCRVMEIRPDVPALRVVVQGDELRKMGEALPVRWPGNMPGPEGPALLGDSLPFYTHPRHVRWTNA
jgi:hypothetical protein